MKYGGRLPRVSRAFFVVAVVCFCSTVVFAESNQWPPEVERALEAAGDNRPELARVLEHYSKDADPQKLQAAIFLITNMEEHGYIENAFFDEHGNEVAFDALNYKNYREALEAKDALEAEHGPIHYDKKKFHADLEIVSADLLIENIDGAFIAWRRNPWAKDVSFDVFCEYILPYRCTNEPVESWRPAVAERLKSILAALPESTDMTTAYAAVKGHSDAWVRFDELYYLHPTDQGYREMCESKAGRCEDMTTMSVYALRAATLLSASDYTPWWPHRDNNHAWTVALDAEGRGKHPDGAPAAKVYRKTFARQAESLGAQRLEAEKVPSWLSRTHYIDVTDQYKQTTDVTITLSNPPPTETTRFAYICVFNGGEWRPIHWGWMTPNGVTFTKMGRNIAYLPAYYVDDAIIPAAPPFILESDGTTTVLDGEADATVALEIYSKEPSAGESPKYKTGPGEYELFYWDNGWQTAQTIVLHEQTPSAETVVPAGRLYWLPRKESRQLERIFTIREKLTRSW